MDYTWKQNRLSKDKEALKNSVLNVIRKKAKSPDDNKMAVAVTGGHIPQITSNTKNASGLQQMQYQPVNDQGFTA